MNQGKIFVLSAPSGTGKTTLLKKVMSEIIGLVFSVSHTTRSPRTGEKDGIDYHFVNRDEFLSMQEGGAFLESAEVHGNLYGTSKKAVLDQTHLGLDVVLDIDVQGADLVRQATNLDAIYTFISPPTLHELEKRLRGRAQDDEDTILVRLDNAKEELQAAKRYEYLIINDDLEEAAKMLSSVVLAERSRNHRSFSGKPFELEY